MAWRKLTKEDLHSALNAAETAGYESAVLATGQTDLVDKLLIQVTADARSRIAACSGNILGEADTVPSGVIYRLMPLVIHRLLTRLGLTVKDARNDDWEESNRWLRDVANCKVTIERPIVDGPAVEQGKYGNAVVVRKGSRKARRSDMEGLL